MSYAILEEVTLGSIADAIRSKNGSSDTYTPSQMVTAIQNISTGTPPLGYRLPYGTWDVPTGLTLTLNITFSGEQPVYLAYTNTNEESIVTTLSTGLNTFSLKPFSWFVLHYSNNQGQSGWVSNLTTDANASVKQLDVQLGGVSLPFGDFETFGATYTSSIFIPTTFGYGTPSATSQTISMNVHTSSVTCFLKGTKITLADRTYKNCEDITFDDELLVWDFYNGCFGSAKPILILKPQITNEYNKLTFSDGTEVKYTGHDVYHRIFNQQAGKFTGTRTDDTPIGAITFKDDSTTPELVSKHIVRENVEFYNIITEKHYNCFTNGILASCSPSNQYHIENMRYVGEKLLADEWICSYLNSRIRNTDTWASKGEFVTLANTCNYTSAKQ